MSSERHAELYALAVNQNQIIAKTYFYTLRQAFVHRLNEYGESLITPEDWVTVILRSIIRNFVSEVSNLRRFSQCGIEFHPNFDKRLEEIAKALQKASNFLDANVPLIHEAEEVLNMASVQIGRLRLRDVSHDRYAECMDERAEKMDKYWQALRFSDRAAVANTQRSLKKIRDDLHHVDRHFI
ncbi:hypothetical protein N7492_006509 [Penicillium capsulatum]|uniref:Uncharacterized protein n=1 Tax=Penicillium capsulatum TaxID=69766 RepID=A0A9W9LJU3_9EURO|nr:hypothetical protein N7492_006509 [Penicillium capsulatum]KAJ6116345.1 hypothetical protein N7512_006070 [Penicillium capsulatum]